MHYNSGKNVLVTEKTKYLKVLIYSVFTRIDCRDKKNFPTKIKAMYIYFKHILFLLVLNCLVSITKGQFVLDSISKRPVNLVYINSGGGSTSASIEYERIFGLWNYRTFLNWKQSLFISEGAGFGIASMQYPEEENEYMTLPVHVSANIGNRASFFESGIGTTFFFGFPERETVTYYHFGYRLEPRRKNKFLFRINVCIPFHTIDFFESTDLIFIPLSLSFGIGF